jgi:hypothetical protein
MAGSDYTLSRREALKLSAAGVLAGSMSGWFDVLASRAAEAAKAGVKHKSCILLWMNGGPSQMDTFDLKPDSPNAGEFKPIPTSVPGIQISEHLPRLAKQMQHMALLRGMSTGEGSHGRARYYMHTGYREGQGGLVYPSLGAIASHQLGRPDFELPNFVAVGGGTLGAGFLGPRHAPLTVTDPNRGVENLRPTVDLAAFDERVSLLQEMEAGFLDTYKAGSVKAHQTTYRSAVDLMHSPRAKAFDLSGESAATRAAYGIGAPTGAGGRGGGGRFGEACLLARRLVEVGVPFVEVSLGGWDTHQNNWASVKRLSEQVDPGMSALIGDLKSRGLLDTTLVIWMGEFGRTPKINSRTAQPGRDHFPRAWTTVLAGGGIKGGQVVGKTSKDGDSVVERPIAVVDFMATVCKILGIDYTKKYTTRDGRPIRIVDKDEKPCTEII